MKFAVFSAIALLISAVSAFHIVPPAGITACDPLTISYDTRTGLAPFSLTFHSDGIDGLVLAAFTDVTGTSFTWDRVTIPAGTNVVIVLGDSRGLGSATGVITVAAGSSDGCSGTSTSIPPLPSVTSEHPPTSSFGSSDLSSSTSSSLSSLSSSVSSSSDSTTTTSTSTDLSSSLSSLSSVISSASSLASSLTVTTSTTSPAPGTTGGLSDNGVARNAAGVFTVGVITVFAGALLA